MLFYVGIYAAMVIAFILWDAFIGWFGQFEFSDRIDDGPTAAFAAAFWPITIPIMMFCGVGVLLSSAKKNRIQRTEEKKRIRIAIETEEQKALREIEEELEHETKSKHAA